MEPSNENTQKALTPSQQEQEIEQEQEREQPAPSNSFVPPVSDIDSTIERLKDNDFSNEEIAVIFTLTAAKCVQPPCGLHKHIYRDEKTHDLFFKRESFSSHYDESHRNASIRRDQHMRINREIAKEYAARHHTVSVNEDDDDMEHEIDDGSPTPFYEAIKAIQERIAKSMKKGLVDESLIWHSKFNGEDLEKRSFSVPSLQELSLNILANHTDAIASLDGVSDELKQRLSALLCDVGKMNGHFLELLLSGFPNVIRLKDCFWLTEEEFIKYFGMLDTSILEVLQLEQCGRVITEYTLLSTLAKSPNCLSRLISLSLTGACRLTDKGLQSLVSAATTLRSINLSECYQLTFASLDVLADSLGSLLKKLYLDDCIRIDVALILSALKRIEHLEVLSLAGLPTVSDKFIKNYIISCGHNIKELVLKDCVNLTDASMKIIAKHCPELHALDS